MYPSVELAGFAAAQAVCCLFDRVPLVPLAFSRRATGAPTVSLLPAGMAVPYRSHHHPEGFAVHRPKFLVSATDGHDTAALTQAFFRGVCAHDMGGRIWNACADQGW